MLFYTVYKTTNIINGKFYIGVHKTEDPYDNYYGSGKILLRAIKKYGKENFIKEILYIFENSEDAFSKEKELVTIDLLEEGNCYNLKVGGYGGFDFCNKNIDLDEYRKRSGIASKKFLDRFNSDEDLRKKYSRHGKRLSEKGIKPNSSRFTGKKHTDETKRKIGEKTKKAQLGSGNSQYNTMWITNGKISKKIKKNEDIPDGFYKGRKQK